MVKILPEMVLTEFGGVFVKKVAIIVYVPPIAFNCPWT